MNGCRIRRSGGVFFCLFLLPLIVSAQTLSTLFTNGPISNRVNIVLLSEGYTSGQLGQFLTDADTTLTNLLTVPPFSEYNSYFNAFAISVASAHSGSQHSFSSFTNGWTYFNSTYDSYGLTELITIPPNDHDANPADGQNKVLNLLSNDFPRHDLVIMVVNDTTYGGSGQTPGSTNPLAIVSLNDSPKGIGVAAHESGHVFGGLADEFEGGAPTGYVPQEWPNVTAQTNYSLVKWAAWVDVPAGTPVPTPDNVDYFDDVGLFQGGQYLTNGWYHPQTECNMLDPGYSFFCVVCSEQLVKCIYGVVDPIDSFLPANTNLSIGSAQNLSFNVTTLQPATHNLAIQWLTNGVVAPGETNSGFQLSSSTLGIGTNQVAVIVSDPTSLVRNDPTHLLFATNIWNVGIDSLSLGAAKYLAGNEFRFTVTGTAPDGVVIQGSDDLADWASLSTNKLGAGSLDYTNNGFLPWEFYRAIALP
jgi:hypothetical protein